MSRHADYLHHGWYNAVLKAENVMVQRIGIHGLLKKSEHGDSEPLQLYFK